jgi:N-acetylmuramoyl-L-alanine amidase
MLFLLSHIRFAAGFTSLYKNLLPRAKPNYNRPQSAMWFLFVPAAVAMVQQFGMPEPWIDPGFGNVIWVRSPNYNRRPDGVSPDTIVLHSTVTPTLEATTRWFYSPESKVSAHFTIGKDGSIVQHVSTFLRAWHAGVSKDTTGRENLNDFSIGIEMVNLNDGKDPYPPEQVEAVRYLILVLKRRFPTIETITSHAIVAQPPGRKSDPKGFPWEALGGLGFNLVP